MAGSPSATSRGRTCAACPRRRTTCSATTPTTPAAPPPGSTTPSATDATAAFCAGIRRDGAGPADAFATLPLWNIAQAKKASAEQLELLDGLTPPPDIKADVATWRKFVQRVSDIASASGADAYDLEPVARQSKKLEPVSQRLTDWGFAHCST